MPNQDERRLRRIEYLSVKSSREVKKSEKSDLLMTHGFDIMIMNGEKSSLSRMRFDIGRLERI